MDSSPSGKARGATLIDSWGRQVAGSGASLVAPVQSVGPSGQPRRVRDRQKDSPASADTPDVEPVDNSPPHSPPPAPHLLLQAVDPDTGRVYWQAPLPQDGSPAPLPRTTGDPGQVQEATPLDGLLIKRAYFSRIDDEADGPHVTRTA